MQVSTAEFRKGLKIDLDGQPYNIVDFQHVKPGKGGAFVRTKLKHLRHGKVVDRTFRAGRRSAWSTTSSAPCSTSTRTTTSTS